MAVDAEGIGQSEGNLGAGLLRKPRRLLEGVLGLVAVEQIALEIDDARRLDERGIDVGGSEMHARAEKRVHGALAVRRHEDEAARGGLAVVGRRGVVGDAERADVVAEDAAELVGGDPADEAAFRPERGKAGDGVGSRASGALDGRAHGLIEPAGFAGRDQAHEALGEVVLGEKGVVTAGDDVDDGVADAHHVVAVRLRFSVPP